MLDTELHDVELGEVVIAHAVTVKEGGEVEAVVHERNGHSNEDVTFAVPHRGDVPILEPPSYTILSILSCLLCFPIGICAVSNSRQVKKLYRAGDEVGASRMSSLALVLSILGFILFACAIIFIWYLISLKQ